MTETVERTSYVGRRGELDAVRALLAAAPLVTLTGPGGVGKTRLAARVAETEPDVVWVSLAELRDPQLLPDTVAVALGLVDRQARTRTEIVVDHLRDRTLLLVLDNCEHLVEACARFADEVLAACPGVRLLTTSRQSLGMAGERVFPVPPLAVPDPDDPGIADNDAVRLFADRATAVVPDFAVTAANAADVARACAALDGLPLAIELAAVRLRSLSVRQLADRLGHRLALLTRGRHRVSVRHGSFQAVLDWSHDLCGPEERLLWARASVFVGGFDLAAAEEVCSGDGLDRADVLDVVDGLIDKSILLREEHRGAVRYRMLETVREYGEDRLRAADDLDRRRRLHRDWCLDLVARYQAEWMGARQPAWIERMRVEHPNLRAALDFCTADRDEAATGLRMACDLRYHWFVVGFEEGRLWCRRLVALVDPSVPERITAGWLDALLALMQGSRDAYLATIDAVDAEAVSDLDRANVLQVRGLKALVDNEADAADLLAAASARFQAAGDRPGELWAQHNLGLALGLRGEVDRAREVLHRARDGYAAMGEVFWQSWTLFNVAATEFLFGDPAAGVDAARAGLRLQHRVGNKILTGFLLSMIAGCTTALGDHARGARLLGAATAAMRRIGVYAIEYAAFTPRLRAAMEDAARGLGKDARDRAFASGAALSTAEAIDYALADTDGGAPAAHPDRDGPLTAREAEIARMVAKGMTNQQVASALGIARRTVETHVQHILGKLDLANRTQIATWVATHG
ncbi:ATP-binding protein [Actinokineospora soli]|uniref:ATP-binding protein n=1 Tax=Actinokineospora soli TaxID=1048753 RepID=A0ABW2TK40_9PSEU